MPFTIFIEPLALLDIQQAIDYYDEKQAGLGKKFESALNHHLISLENNPFFKIRYDRVRCVPVNKYPYMIHFTIEEVAKSVTVRAVFHTSLDPDNWTYR